MEMSVADNEQTDRSLEYAARTATANGTAVDTGRDAFQRMGLIDIGNWTDGTHKITFQDSPDNSTWTTLTAAQLDDPGSKLDATDENSVNITDATEDDSQIEIGLLSTERYVRAVQTVSGGPGTGVVLGVNIVTTSYRNAGGAGQPMSASGKARTVPST